MKVVVVGAGILGASTAFHLALRGVDVEIVDRAHEGKATLAGAGIVCPWATSAAPDDPDWYRLYSTGAAFYPSLIASLAQAGESEVGYRQVGALVVAGDLEGLDSAEERIVARAAQEPAAGDVRRLTPTQARRLFPALREDAEAVHIAGAGRVDARDLAAAMVRASVALGAVRRDGLVTLRPTGGGVECIDESGGRIDADEVVVTGGAWASQILEPLGIAHPVVPQKGQIVHLHLPGVDTSRWPVVLPMSSHYIVPFDDGRVVIGATRETGSGFDTRVTAAGEHEVLRNGLTLAPGLANATHLETRVGLRPAAATVRPILGRVDGLDGLTIGNGLGAGGITIGPFAGRELASIVLGGDHDPVIDGFGPRPPVDRPASPASDRRVAFDTLSR